MDNFGKLTNAILTYFECLILEDISFIFSLSLDDPSKPFKEEGDRIFFSYDDKISMSIEYYDPEAANAKATHPGIQKSLTNGKVNGSVDGNDSSGECEDKELSKTNNNNNPNKRYLECPGSVKVQHLKKFITMKYELSEDFLVSKKV